MTDRAASEAIGFVLVFAIVTSTVGIVYATGFTGLADTRDAAQLRNMERAFDVLDDNVGDLIEHGAPSRATEIQLSGGDLTLADPVELRVETNSSAPGLCNETRPLRVATRPLVYEEDGSRVVYSAGALLRARNGNSAMLSGPGWVDGRRRSAITIPDLSADGAVDVGGRTTVLVATSRGDQSLECTVGGPDPVEVNITVESPRASAWKNHFEAAGYDVRTIRSGMVSGTFPAERVYVSAAGIEVEISP